MALLTGRGSLIAGVLAAIGASVCCVGPLMLLALGIGGSWVGSLTAMEPYRPLFCRPDTAVSRAGLAQALPGATGLHARHAVC